MPSLRTVRSFVDGAFTGGVLSNDYARAGILLLVAIVLALVATALVSASVRWLGRTRGWSQLDLGKLRRPFRVLAVAGAAWAALEVAGFPGTLPVDGELGPLSHALLLLTIALAAWFVCRVVIFAVDLALERYRIDVADNRVARRVRTQVLILRRLGVVLVVVLAAAWMLLTFPGARAAGTSLLASAGLVSVLAGLAAQSTLANVFAGMQLAFSGAIRVDDVVIVEGEWGRIEEITLTYVVVHIWDDRRMVLPSTYFTTTPFQNWTRRNSELLGSVEFDLDWRATPNEMREAMHRILDRTDLWDKRTAVLQITDALGGLVRVRILVTAVDAPTLFDLRCHLREELVAWLHARSPESIPRQRVQLVEADAERKPRRPTAPTPSASSASSADRVLFAGDDAASAERARAFTGPVSTLRPEEVDEARTR